MGKLTVLMVNRDNRYTGQVYDAVLGLEWIRVFFASCSSEAIKLLKGSRFDLMTYRITGLSYERLDKEILFLLHAIEAHKKSILIISPGPSPAMEALMNHFNGSGQIDWIVGWPEEAALFRIYDRLLCQHHALVTKEASLPPVEGPIFENMVGQGPAILRVFSMIRSLASHTSVVLITGPTGTGKEMTARAIHNLSPRRSMRFVACNCAAIPENLIESELFGHVKGAFTGASEERDGLFRYANGGTIFLDEISEMPLALQAKLLRVIEERHVRPVGSDKAEAIDVRIIAATNNDLWKIAQEGTFRKDLYYRLNVTQIVLPSLRDRPEDHKILCDYFLDLIRRQYRLGLKSCSDDVLKLFYVYPWLGNLRELKNVLESASLTATHELLTISDLPQQLQEFAIAHCDSKIRASNRPNPLELYERHRIEDVISKYRGNKTHAARELGVSRRSLYRQMEKHQISFDQLLQDT